VWIKTKITILCSIVQNLWGVMRQKKLEIGSHLGFWWPFWFFLYDSLTLGPKLFSRPLPSNWYWKWNCCIKLKWKHKNIYARPPIGVSHRCLSVYVLISPSGRRWPLTFGFLVVSEVLLKQLLVLKQLYVIPHGIEIVCRRLSSTVIVWQ